MKLSDLAANTRANISVGDPEMEITGAAGLDIAGEGEVTFLANPKYTPQIKTTLASAIYLNETEDPAREDIAVLRAKDPYLAYTRALRLFHPEAELHPDVHPSATLHETADVALTVEMHANAVVGPNCKVASGVRIMPNVTLYENVEIGENCIIHANVSIRENSVIGSNCIIHNNCTIGCDGFGYAKDVDKRWLKIPQTGRVVIEDDVEIGAGTTIDRASVGESRIGRGSKIDNLVQIGHSCTVGEDTLLCAQVGLAGSSHIGSRVILAGQVGVAGHLKVGDDVVITAKGEDRHEVPAGKITSGIPAFDNRDWLRSTAAFRRLGDIQRTVRDLERRMKNADDTD